MNMAAPATTGANGTGARSAERSIGSPTAHTRRKSMKILYHANCYDGFGAAWSAWLKLEGLDAPRQHDYIPVLYGDPPPDGLDGQDIVIVDFSYPRDILLELY